MPHDTSLIAILAAGFALAFLFGVIAHRLRLSPIAGYLLAGVLVGPHTPGFVGDQGLADQLAELGVILLMFGVGLHFSVRDLARVRRIALPGAVAQMSTATVLGMGLGWGFGWPPVAGVVFGLALSVASTVVLLRALEARGLVASERGRIAVGWLIVEDIAVVLALVALPVVALIVQTPDKGAGDIVVVVGQTIVRVAGFVAVMLILGRRIVPWLLHQVAHMGSRELFRLAVLALAIGVGFGAAALFGVSFALGAFFAGMVLAESPLSQRAAEETLPLRDAFAVLFFVSVGMLFYPGVLLERPLAVLATLFVIVVGKSIAAYVLVRLFGHDRQTGLTVAVSLAQIGEFSFILAGLGIALGVLPAPARDLVLAGAFGSILLNPLLFTLLLDRHRPRPAAAADRPPPAAAPADSLAAAGPTDLGGPVDPRDHIILVGFGRVGRHLARALAPTGQPVVVIDILADRARQARLAGLAAMTGNAARPEVLARAGLAHAKTLVLAIPDGLEAGEVAERAAAARPGMRIVARALSGAEARHLEGCGATDILENDRVMADALHARLGAL